MYTTSNFRNGLKILVDGIPYEITYFQHVKPGKGGAFVRTKLMNLLNQSVVEKTFRATERVERPDIQECSMQLLYASDDGFHFMDINTYEQIVVPASTVGDRRLYLKENEVVKVLLFNQKVVSIELPSFVILAIAQCDPGVRGDTVSGATKPAIMETGAVVQVPLFVNEKDHLKIDTRTGEYIERA
ncbi:MAG: elongation factor P [Deltaproteobacteria bacterium]|nr:elongation factor P [Deltaproteobacteria bacterium]